MRSSSAFERPKARQRRPLQRRRVGLRSRPLSGRGPNAFNPAISLILSALTAPRRTGHYAITGVQLPSSVSIGPANTRIQSFGVRAWVAASVDPWFRGAANIAVAPDNTGLG